MSELCSKCGAPVHRLPGDPLNHRLCRPHLREALANAPVFVDGNFNVTGCVCDRDGNVCEMPCWQRVGLTADPCCPGCPPLPEPDPEPAADVIPLRTSA